MEGTKRGASAYEKAGLWSRVSFSWAGPLIQKGWHNIKLEENDATFLMPEDTDAPQLADQFEAAYSKLKAKYAGRSKTPNLTTLTLLRLYWLTLLRHSFWVLFEVAIRLLSPLALRYFLTWLQTDQQSPQPQWLGWCWALAVAAGGMAMTLVHHQFFWIGMRMGFTMRQQVVAAIHAKVLRLNSAAVAHANSGTIINLASNDVRRFDEGFSFWLFCWAGPLEAGLVLLMVSLELGFVPAVCGMAAMLAVIPMQALLVRTIAGLRRNTAARTDERVRLTGEVIQGCLAMKMLGWEDPFTRSISSIRSKEVVFAGRMAQIRGLNLSLQFCMTPVVAFVTFSVYKAMNGTLYLPSVFYALSLLHLPKLYLVYFAVIGFQYMTETYIAVQRIDKFLSMPEPPPPVHMRAASSSGKSSATGAGAAAAAPSGAAAAAPVAAAAGAKAGSIQLSGSKGPDQQAGKQQQQQQQQGLAKDPPVFGLHFHHQQQQQQQGNGAAATAGGGPAAVTGAGAVICDYPDGYVELGGADYDWNTNVDEMAAQDTSHRPQQASTLMGAAAPAATSTPTSPPAAAQTRPADAAAAAAAPGSSSITVTATRSASGATSRSSLDAPGIPRKTLSGVRLVVNPGELVAVVGEVGSGKSSLLAALLGELMPMRGPDGTVHGGPVVVGRVAYCSQVPWIMAASLRDNILFQAPMDPEHYNTVIDACALGQDLAELPAGDATELGERGVNLSGGQKARVALARAAYSRASVQLLDDPLSAVDPRVGRILFDRCIGPTGILAGTTRVLVTHQRQYLPKCDRVAVLRAGVLVACGTWPELLSLQLPELVGGAVTMSLDAAEEEDEEVQDEVQDEQQQQQQQQGHDRAVASMALAAAAVTSGTAAANGTSHSAAAGDVAGGAAPECFESAAAAPFPGGSGAAASDIGSSSIAGSGSSSSSSEGQTKLESILSRTRTMAPDVNRRPADSGKLVSSSSSKAGSSRGSSWYRQLSLTSSKSFGVFARALSRSFSRKEFEAADRSAAAGTAAAEVGYTDVGSAFGQAQVYIARSISGLFVPPAYLPDGIYSAPSLKRETAAAAAAAQVGSGKGSSSTPAGPAGQLVAAEKRETGSVSWGVYGAYCKQLGFVTCSLLLMALVGGQAVFLAAEWWLAMWAASSPEQQQHEKWLMVYGILTGGVIVVALTRSGLFFWATMIAATRMHNSMVLRVLRAPLAFFHTNPAGRVLNRFSNDQGRVDDMLPMALFDVLQSGFVCLGAFVLVAVAVPFILPVFVLLLVAFYYYRQRYITTSREVKRWDATSRSPVYASFSTTLKGLPTIRAYGAESHFQASFVSYLSLNGQWWYAYLATARWIGFRLDLISTVTLASAVVLAMAVRQQVAAAILGLALTHVLQLTGMLQWWTRQTVEVENNMTCVERMVEYCNLPQEPPRLCDGGAAPPAGWPSSGAITYNNVTARYRPGLPSVLKNLSFSLGPGCSCGVVGRTGSGKSSLMLTLFRLIDISEGSIYLDGLDTSNIGLDALRRQLAIIPQDPVLFSGTLRSNLDPWDQHDDAALWQVLGAVQLKAAIRAAGGLRVRMAEAGDNLSVGQRQLFCLARALLQEARVLALDEATANVDRSTDALIQQSLREFAGGESGKATGRVLLVIAHRIDTILDCDHLLVLSNGVLVEQGSPKELAAPGAAEAGGVFAGMVAAAKAASAGHHH